MRILVTNDDGIFSEGIQRLAEAAAHFADEVFVVAPDREQSASSHALTLHRPLRLRKVRTNWFAVDGTPTDCVNLAVQGLLKESGPPDLVLSGINFGPNLGDDVTYSGTVSAAFEANLLRLPAIAFSQRVGDGFSFATAGELARRFLAAVLREPLARDLLLNVNLPLGPCQGLRLTRLGHRTYDQTVVEKLDPKGRKYFWIAGTPQWEEEEGTDHRAIHEGYVSVTPLHLDLTDYPGLDRYAALGENLRDLGRDLDGHELADGVSTDGISTDD